MNDADLARTVQAIFDADDPADGLDRSDGLGEDHHVESLRIVPGDDGFDDLEVTIVGGGRVVRRLLFDRTWRAESGLVDPHACAAYVVAKWRSSRLDRVRPTYAELELRRRHAGAGRTRTGVLEAVGEDGKPFFVHVTPQEWRQFAAGRPDPVADLEKWIGARWDDEAHIVFFRGSFHCSVRAELPPVRSRLLREGATG
ncbi:MAG: hypothetical protein JWR27_1485 [Aeromicrobium sp.]|nr:hypothetical protein [Aeromicrobium sp.]